MTRKYTIFTTSGEYTEEDGPLTQEKALDVQVILQEDAERGPYFQSGSNYYVWQDDRWVGVDFTGLILFLIRTGQVLLGRMTTNEEYQEIYQKAKSKKKVWWKVWANGERRPMEE